MQRYFKSIFFLLILGFWSAVYSSDLQWVSPPTTISTAGVASSNPFVALNDQGQAVAIWSGSSDFKVYVATHTTSGGWSSPTVISDGNSTIFDLRVVLNNSGHAVANWVARKTSDSLYHLQYATYSFGGSWAVSDMPAPAQSSAVIAGRMDINNNDQVVAAWIQFAAGTISNHFSQLTFGGSWTNTQALETTSFEGVPAVAINDSGQMVTVWPDTNDIRFSSTTFGSTFPASTQVATGTTVNSPNIALNASGQIVIGWSITSTIKTATATFGGAFSSGLSFDSSGSNTDVVNVAINTSGNMLVTWNEENGGSTDFVRASTSAFGSGTWSTQIVSQDDDNTLSSPVSILNDENAAVLIWLSQDTLGTVQASHSDFGGSWAAPTTLSSASKNALTPTLAGSENRMVLAGWENDTDGTIEVLFGLYPPEPPGAVSGKQKRNRSLSQTEYYNQIEWVASPSHFVTYHLFANGSFVTSTPSTTFRHRRQKRAAPVVYTVKAVNQLGQESEVTTGLVP